MTVKGAKMCVIVNPKCNPKFDMNYLEVLTGKPDLCQPS